MSGQWMAAGGRWTVSSLRTRQRRTMYSMNHGNVVSRTFVGKRPMPERARTSEVWRTDSGRRHPPHATY